MIEYPKIETYYVRDERSGKVVVDKIRCEEFSLVTRWDLTEKIDGTNVRIGFTPDGRVTFSGRTDRAQIQATLVQFLRDTFTEEKMRVAFPAGGDGLFPEATLFGEGYGPKIQNGGEYRSTVSVRLFDVVVGNWWLERASVLEIAVKLGVRAVPNLGMIHADSIPKNAEGLSRLIGRSVVAKEDEGPGCRAEGIVARTSPLLLCRSRQRVMWKLKFKDFA